MAGARVVPVSTMSTKRPRLSTSCNWCRSHKLKCDTEQPSCSNCRRRNVECITTDLRKPGSVGRRVEGQGRQKKRNDSMNLNNTPPSEHQSVNPDTFPDEDYQTRPGASQSPAMIISPAASSTPLQDTTRLPNNSNESTRSDLPIFSLPFSLDDHEVGAGVSPPPESSPLMQQHSVGSDLTMLTDNTTGRLQMMGISSSLYILVQWLDLFFAQRPDWSPVFPNFRRGMAYTVEMPLPFPVSLPSLPSAQEQEEYISIFTKKIHPIFPVLDLDTLRTSLIASTSKMERDPSALDPKDYPALACAYAVFSISADEKYGCITVAGTRYLEAAYFLHAYLLAMPYVESVQALLLLSIVLRSRNKDGASWGTLGQAIRMAQSIGLHRHISPNNNSESRQPGTAESGDLHSRIWWTAYCLERTMELETGRPSAIQDYECDQVLPAFSPFAGQDVASFDYFRALIDLAKIQTQISDRLYRKKLVKRQTEQLLHDSGLLDRALLDWAEKLPEGIRPSRDIFWDPEQVHLATFLSLQFHHTIIALHRPALMSGAIRLRERVDVYCSGTLWRFRLRNSMCICASSARSIVRAMNDLAWQKTHSRLITVTHVTLAMVVLAIYISRTKSSWINESDLALLKNCSEYAEQQYIQMGQDADFIRVCTLVRSQLTDHVYGSKGGPFATNFPAAPSSPMSMLQQSTLDDPLPADFGNDFFGGSEFDELWPYLWGDDLSQVYLSGAESDVLNKHLLGLPLSE